MNISVLNMGKREMLIKLEREYLFQNIGSSLRTSFMMEENRKIKQKKNKTNAVVVGRN